MNNRLNIEQKRAKTAFDFADKGNKAAFEIFEKRVGEYDESWTESAIACMDEYAEQQEEQQAIAFFKWNEGVLNGFFQKSLNETDNDIQFENCKEKMHFDFLTVEEKYELFLKSKLK